MSGAAGVLARYDELADLLASIADRPAGDAALGAVAAALLGREARLLDRGRLAAWLAWFTDDAVAWIPLTVPAHPAVDQSLYLDDRRRLGERVAWHADPSAWGQHPASACVRTTGSVEAWREDDDVVVVSSSFTILEHRHGEVQVVAGRQVHQLVGPDLRCRSKIVVVPQLAVGVRNPSFLL
jgi:3-phenylpropionate/cinnamic acid dioxygenase small subunit